ncbi:MAG: hypothetical protein Wins2KO_03100 [Winogradskyella sp.]
MPMIIMQLGIAYDYWGDLTDNAWSVHIHYWTGTLWYIYLIIQPYYATHGQLERHRTNGIIGMFLAGGVCLTALSMMHRDIQSVQNSIADPERFGPFEPYFFYGIIAMEIPMILAFGYAVIQSIKKRKQLENHAWWLISTVFIIMLPALGRGVQFLQISMSGFTLDINPISGLIVSNVIIIGLIIITAFKYKHLKHPATYLAIGVNIFNCFMEPLGRWPALQEFFNAIIKG